MQAKLPPGPSAPSAIQMIGFWSRPIVSMERARAKYGKRFTVRLLGAPPFVIHSEPDHIKEIFSAPPDVLHPGEGARLLEPIVGANSLILLDEGPHLSQRKLLLPALHGDRMKGLDGLMREVTEREVASWPRDEAFVTHDRLTGLTLEIILRAVFGLDPGPRLDEMRSLLAGILEFSMSPTSMIPFAQRSYFGRGPFVEFSKLRSRADELISELIAERRADGAGRDDVLTMLLAAEHEDGSPMSEQELRDELMTLLTAGHETTASQLSWAFAILAREPRVQDELIAEIEADEDNEYLTATVREILRRRPVLPNAEPRLVKKEVEIGGWTFPPDVSLIANAYLLHHDPDIYPDPYAFRPERFVGEQPGTYTWIPFGGGRRRCIGAAFASMEMRTVLRAVFEAARLEPGADAPEPTRRRAITISPKAGGSIVLRDRTLESPVLDGAGRGRAGPRLVLEQRVAVLAAFVGELGDRGHPLVVVRLDLVEARADAAGGAGAEGVGDVALLAGGLDALVLEDLRDAGDHGDLGEDVRDRRREPLLLELALHDLLAVLAQQPLGDRAQLLDLIGDRVGVLLELGVRLGDLVRPHLLRHPVADVVEDDADRPDRVAEADVAELPKLLADRLHPGERDERVA